MESIICFIISAVCLLFILPLWLLNVGDICSQLYESGQRWRSGYASLKTERRFRIMSAANIVFAGMIFLVMGIVDLR